MITLIEPERGGEEQGILRVELSMPMAPAELLALRDWLVGTGWSVEAEQIDSFFAGRGWQG